ncbi:obg-like ATPase 1 [Sphaeroforma arctica JP610]|uniref:Obg-like ATPase 1 n=1 Tax=Sphaeroforma arctica JP610 TaxID=667725 RepID=A0A0L0G641_9EUKA|nr:obg-like ATPase 1 [Sphaeroforma arctica JP610]KNC84414.1 obg-like ATPase 1 [Sphaeroforma arctica JP610]|eukprot:XP_014158316.1 obg-like ATPase 1 [Sphaeroforma arctica JP610]
MPPKKKVEAAAVSGAARFGRVKNSLKFGLVGLPNVGKSSLFNLLTAQNAEAANYPFCTIEPNESRCAVPDDRYDYLCSIWKPPSEYPAYLQITDIAGLVKGASEGKGLGNAFLSHIQAVDGYFHIVRAFEDPDVTHVDDGIDPIRDAETIQHELCLKDLDALSKAYKAEEVDVKKTQGSKLSQLFIDTMEKVKVMLEKDIPVRDGEWSSPEVDMIKRKLHTLITTKPCIYLVNLSAKDYIRKKNKWLVKLHQWIQAHGGGQMIPFSVEYEQELWDLRDDATALAEQEKVAKSVLPKAIVNAYHELNLIHFFTAGEKEVRCWTVYGGAAAPAAAGVIHTDFERGFIKAEVVSFEDFKELNTGKGMVAIKEAGKYKQEGKQYIVQDGDIIHFQFNVTTQKKK